MQMGIDQVIRNLISRNIDRVWVNEAANSYGKEMVQLLDAQGNELAWRWFTDGYAGWQDPLSTIGNHSFLPTDASDYDLSQGFSHAIITLGMEDRANYSKMPPRPDWCR